MTATRAARTSHRLEERRSSRVDTVRSVRSVRVCPGCHSPVTAYGCASACRGLDTD